MTSNPIVSIVDSVAESGQAIRAAVAAAGHHAEAFESASHFLDTVDPGRPGCVVITSGLAPIGGLAPYEHVLSRMGHAPLILRCSRDKVQTIVHAIALGAHSVVDIQCQTDELVPLVLQCLKQDAQVRAKKNRLQDFQGRFSQLSSDELVVFGLVAAGKLNKQIESLLGIKRRTVEDRRARVMRKLNVKTVPELVEFAVQIGH